MILVWADTHFNHAGIILHCRRPYEGVAEMNDDLVDRWNEAVRPQDTVFLLGDFGFGSEEQLRPIFDRLRGHKNLVVGNHDERNPRVMRLPWESVHDLVTLREEGRRAVACHYPMETWKGAHRGYLMLHGHSHGSLRRKLPHRFDVGADVFETPVALAVLWGIAQTERYEVQDHHGEDL